MEKLDGELETDKSDLRCLEIFIVGEGEEAGDGQSGVEKIRHPMCRPAHSTGWTQV